MDYRPIVEFHRECGAGVTVGALHVPLAEAGAFGVLQAVAEGRAFAWQADKGQAGAFYWRDVGTLQSYRLAALDHLDPDHAPVALPVTLPVAQRPSRMARWAAQSESVLMTAAAVSTHSRLHQVILRPDAVVPIGLHLGLDPEEDARHFRLCPDSGTLLVTGEMLHAHALSRRPLYAMPPAAGFPIATTARCNCSKPDFRNRHR